MNHSAERYYEFLTRDQALDLAPIDYLNMEAEPKRVLKEAYRRMAPYLAVVSMNHLDYDGKLKAGQMVIHRDLVDTIRERFNYLLDSGFAIEKIRPHVLYGYNDAKAMADNNTSGGRPDYIGKPRRGILSKHFVAAAFDVEPVHNKQRERNGLVVPPYTEDYEIREASMLMYNLAARLEFSDNGLEYGGTWHVAGIEKITGHPDFYPGAPADEHHFELRDEKLASEGHLLDMRDLALPSGIIYEHPGRIRAAF